MDSSLGQAAFDRQPVFYSDATMAWEQRLALAYDEASKYVSSSMAPGQTLDLASYELAADVAGDSLQANSEAWRLGFAQNQDVGLVSAINLGSQQCTQYYLGHYAQACSNLGAFVTGYAREQIVLGALSQDEFDKACDLRIRAFSDIIYLGRTGALPSMLNATGWSKANGIADPSIVIATPGISTLPSPVSGLGLEPVTILIGIAIVGVLVGAGIGVAMYMSAENAKLRRAALEICQDAVRRNHPSASAICASAKDAARTPSLTDALLPEGSLADKIVSKDLQDKLVMYGALGLGTMLLIQFAPQIMSSLSKTYDVYAEQKIKRLRRLEDLGEDF